MRFQWLWNVIQEFYIFFVAAFLFAAGFLRKRQVHIYRKFLLTASVIYGIVLLYVTILGRRMGTEPAMELSFLWEYRLALQGNVAWAMQILSNIFLFIPMGWLFGGLYKKAAWYKAAAFGCMSSLMIETTQLVFRLGLFEFDDMLNNTMGMLLGYGCCYLTEKMCGTG